MAGVENKNTGGTEEGKEEIDLFRERIREAAGMTFKYIYDLVLN